MRMVSTGIKMRPLVPLFPSLPIFWHHADDVEIDAVQQDRAAHRGASGKDVLQQLPTHDRDPTMLVVVFVIEPAPGTHRHVANLVIARGDPEHLAVGAPEFADRANVFAVQDRRNGAEELGLIADGNIVVVGEMVLLAGLQAAFDRGNATRER